ncbi:MAG: hypothetical protein M1127_02385 [Patescibacteria group bacterium]|nr:hypothetical protein [Patescibacteria group bacterium]
MANQQKIYLTAAVFTAFLLLLVFLAVVPSLKLLGANSIELSKQRGELVFLQKQISGLNDFQRNFSEKKPLFDKISSSFVSAAAPISFLEFLEQEARDNGLIMNVVPQGSAASADNLWQNLDFKIVARGDFVPTARFLSRVENSAWLIEILQLDIAKISEAEAAGTPGGDIKSSVVVRVFAKKQ